jgi:sugar transferase (PEP-CTERM/EpsH1 system associated)
VYVELLPGKAALLKAGLGFVKGGSLTTTYYSSRRLEEHLKRFENAGIAAAVVFSSAMASYAPEGIPLLVDMVDVDSEKWSQYGELRWPGFLYRREAARLREVERRFAMRASCTFLTTEQERRILEKIAPGSRVRAIENGVDFDFFNPERCGAAEPAGAAYVAFVGVMDYFPNADACCWFAGQVMPELVRRVPGVEFWIVGRNPSRAVARLCERQGIRVVGGVPDVRPYVAGARAVVAPLRIARGVQNKVLEALAMGKPVLASDAVCRSFGGVPEGVIRCQTAEDYLKAVEKLAPEPAPQWHESIRNSARERFQWENNMQAFLSELESVIGGQG